MKTRGIFSGLVTGFGFGLMFTNPLAGFSLMALAIMFHIIGDCH